MASIHIIINGLDRLFDGLREDRPLAGGIPAFRKWNQRPRGPIVIGGVRRW